MRLIIAGSRDFGDYTLLKRRARMVTAGAHEVVVLCGGARGADALGKLWAEEQGHPVEVYPADWEKHGRSAGPIRNLAMAEKADTLLAFWDGQSRGTKNMIDTARSMGLKVVEVRYAEALEP